MTAWPWPSPCKHRLNAVRYAEAGSVARSFRALLRPTDGASTARCFYRTPLNHWQVYTPAKHRTLAKHSLTLPALAYRRSVHVFIFNMIHHQTWQRKEKEKKRTKKLN